MPDVSTVHVNPPSVVFKMVPLAPTAQPMLLLSMSTPLRLADVGPAPDHAVLTWWTLLSGRDRLVRLAAVRAAGEAPVASVPDVGDSDRADSVALVRVQFR